MAIKKQTALTKGDFEAALVTLRLSVSEVSRESGIPRHIVSHFRNYGDGLKMEQAAKLQDFFESKGLEFTDDEEDEELSQTAQSHSVASPSPRLDASLKVEYFFPLSNNIPDDVICNAMDIMEENDARLAVLLKGKAEHDEGFFSDGALTEETQAALQETFALLAGNYVIFRMLRGWRAFNQPPADENSKTVRDMLLETFKQPLIDAGLIDADMEPEPEVDEVQS